MNSSVLTALGVILTIAGIAVSLFLGFKSDTKPNPQLAIVNGPVPLFDPQLTTSFDLVPEAEEIIWGESNPSDPVWAVTIAVWNGGKIKIENENVLSEMFIQLGSEKQLPKTVWEFRVLERSRCVTKFNLVEQTVFNPDGTLDVPVREDCALAYDPTLPHPTIPIESDDALKFPIEFRILEEDDGARLLLIYSGARDLPIVLGGTIEDRKDVGIFPRTKKWSIWRLAVGFVTIPLAILFFGLYTKVLTQRINLPWPLSTLAVPVEIIITFSWAPLLAVAI
jgi:hypothetical protein